MRSKNISRIIKNIEALMEVGEYNKARGCLTKLIKKDQKNPEPHYLLGECFCKLRKFDQAITELHLANSLLPDNPLILELLGWTFFMSGDSKTGREFMEASLALAPNEIQTFCDLAVLEMKEGNEKAIGYAEKALEIAPDDEMVKNVFIAVNKFLRARKQFNNKSLPN